MNPKKVVKRIRFSCPARLDMNDRQNEESSRIRPILGQNQINVNNFMVEFNKVASQLNPDTEVRVLLSKFADKTFVLRLFPAPLHDMVSSLGEPLDECAVQDLIYVVEELYAFFGIELKTKFPFKKRMLLAKLVINRI